MQLMFEWGEIIMKIVTEPQGYSAFGADMTSEDGFFEGLSPELLAAICRGLDAPMRPMALVSQQLMVLQQTRSCAALLAHGTFYSLWDVLGPEECDAVQCSLRTGMEDDISLLLSGERWNMRIFPAEEQALLIFRCDVQHQAGISMATARVRESAARLLIRADILESDSLREDACVIRREALRILRQANHAELLSGAREPMQREMCSTAEILTCAQQQLAHLGVQVAVQGSEDISLWADKGLLLSALMTLISNSLRHGGPQVNIWLYAGVQGSSAVFGVDDDGTGLSAQALAHMNDTWRMTDALVGGWGLGIPYARRIAELHGGALMFAPGSGGGCTARISIPLDQEIRMENANSYHLNLAASANAADIELSDVLDAAAFGARS